MRKPSITIFGAGRVGGALQKSLTKAGYSIISIFDRNTFPNSIDELGDVIFLTVHDRDIQGLTEKLAAGISKFGGKHVIHCSGVLDSSVLRPVQKKGAGIASFHPLKAVTLNDDSLEGVWFDMEGDASSLSLLESISEDLGAHSFKIEPAAKPLLHAAAVVSANYLVTLLKIATDIANTGNIDRDIALKALLPLTESSLQNVKETGFDGSLTGPISRGDVETIQRHIDKLSSHPELLAVYKSLGSQTLKLVDGMNPDRINELKEILKS